MKDNLQFLKEEVVWHNINEDGHIEGLKNEAAIYIYKLLSDKSRVYVGSSVNLAGRVSKHKSDVNKFFSGCPIFYNSVYKYGWKNFQFGILEHIKISNGINKSKRRDIMLKKEQYYLDNIKPSLNVCIIAECPLGVKRDIAFSEKLSKAKRGKTIIQPVNLSTIIKTITPEVRLKMSSSCKGIKVKIYDKNKKFIKDFPTMTSAAEYLGVSRRTINNRLVKGISYDDYIYEFEVQVSNPVVVINKKSNTTKIYNAIREAARDIGVSNSCILKYINTNKLLNKTYLISKESNSYIIY